MSIRKMISLHPQAGGHLNEPLAQALRHATDCAVICVSCADACVAERMPVPSDADGNMAQCIRACLDCADICAAVSHVAARRTGHNERVLRALLQACVEACDACAAECERHDHAHCRHCAVTCRECAADCREALATLG